MIGQKNVTFSNATFYWLIKCSRSELTVFPHIFLWELFITLFSLHRYLDHFTL